MSIKYDEHMLALIERSKTLTDDEADRMWRTPETWTTETQPTVPVTEGTLDGAWENVRPARAGDVIEVPCPECGGEGGVPCDVCRRQQCAMCTDCDGSGTLRVLLTEDPVEQWVHDYGHHGWLCTGVPETGDET